MGLVGIYQAGIGAEMWRRFQGHSSQARRRCTRFDQPGPARFLVYTVSARSKHFRL